MKIKTIALAVSTVLSGATLAQSNVTIYGVADASYIHASDSYAGGTKALSKMYSGGQSGSRLGFKGSEDLGDGLSANFQLEAGINIDNGTAGQGGRTFGRWSTVGLAGKNWGEVQLGRRDTFMDEVIGGIDAQGRNTVAQASPIMQDVGRYSNMFAYISPVWGGLQLKAGVVTAAYDADEVAPTGTDSNNRAWTVAATYTNGPLNIGFAYERNKIQSTNTTSFSAGNQWVIAAGYDFGVVALSAEYGQIKNGDSAVLDSAIDNRKQWTVGAAVPIGSADKVAVQYARGRNDFHSAAIGKEKASMWGVSYYHDLSKRTNIYAGYGNLSQSDNNTVKYGLDDQGTYQSAFQLGLRHQF